MYIKNKIIYPLGLASIVLLSINSCKTPTELQNIPLPEYAWENYKTLESETSGDVEKEHLDYTRFYNDPLLIDLIELALDNNLETQILQQRIIQAEASYKLSKKAWLPLINGEFGTNNRLSPLDKNLKDWNNTSQWNLGLNAQWEIDIWGKLKYLRDAEEAKYLQIQITEKQIKNNLIAQIAEAYYQLIALKEALEITNKTIENWEQTVETMKALKIAGRVTEAAVTQSEAQLSSIKTSINDLKTNILKSEQHINYLLGRPQQSIETRAIDKDQKLPILEIGIPSDLLIQRPDLRIAYENVRATFFEKEAAKKYFLPSLTLTGSLGFNASQFSDIINPISLLGNIAGGLLQPIFHKGTNQARLQIAKAEEKASLYELESVYIQACMEVENLLYAFNQEQEKIKDRKEEIEKLRLSVEYTEELLESGFAIYTEVITAKQQLLQAELSGINDFIERQKLLIQLFNASGGGI